MNRSQDQQDLKIRPNCSGCDLRAPGHFCDLNVETLKKLEHIKVTRVFPKGSKLFSEGQPADGVYLLCQGKVKLSTCSAEGKVIILRIAGCGEVLGLGAVIAGSEYEASAEVLELCQVNFVHRDDFTDLLKTEPDASLNAIQHLCRNYRDAHRMICSLGHSDSAVVKLAKLFLSWNPQATDAGGELHIHNPFTHEDMAEMIGTTRETVTRSLKDLRDRGLVTNRGSHLIIHDPEMLRRSVRP
jgi:CRP/FNR family transcriptional regulator, cyclic AMP receptor protein